MTRAIKGLRPAGLPVVMCCLMAFGVDVAQAEPGAAWIVNGSPITNALKVQGQASLVGNHGIVLVKIGLSTVEILCTTLEFAHALLEESGSGKGKIGVKGCVTKLNGKEATACLPHSPGSPEGTIITNSGTGLIVLHSTSGGHVLLHSVKGGNVDLVVLLPEAGGAFVTLQFGTGGCSIGNNIEITGTLFVKDSQEEGLVDKVTHEVEEGPLTKLLFGANPMKIDGKLKVFLGGPHAGMTVSGIAN